MTTKEFMMDFRLFDGEGGEGAGESSASSSTSSQDDVRKIQYGKSEGDGQAKGQVGSDNSGQADSLEAEWNALTGKGGKFHDMLGQRVSDAIQSRFRNQADLQGQVDQISSDLSPLFMNYGLEAGDFEGLKNAIANDDTFYQAGAEKAGLDVQNYKQMLKLKADSERLQKIDEAYRREQARQAKYAEWEADAEELQQAFPGFDLGAEIESSDMFAQLLDSGIDVRTAFFSVHADDILNGNSAYASKTATQNVVNTIQQRAARPVEGALGHTPAIQRKTDPSTLSDDDLDEINRRVARGETISF